MLISYQRLRLEPEVAARLILLLVSSVGGLNVSVLGRPGL